MKKIIVLFTGMLLIAAQAPVFADGYAGLSYSQTRIGISDAPTVGGIYAKLGQNLSENIQGELRLGAGLENDDGFGELGIESLIGTYFRFGIDVESFYPHLILGYTEVDIETRFGNSGGDSDISYGLGTDFEIRDNWNINLEYMIYYDKDDVALKSASLGFSVDF